MHGIKEAFDAADLSSRAKRRKAAALAARLLERIRDAEEAYMGRIPINLQNSEAYDNADCSIALLDEAIDVIGTVFE